MFKVEQFPMQHQAEFASLIGHERFEQLADHARRALAVLDGSRVININATATGGGVAEMLQVLLSTTAALGIDSAWWVLDGTPEFFAITKRIHNTLHGNVGDGGELGPPERAVVEEVIADNLRDLVPHVRPGDLVIAHDPQTAPLIPALRELGAKVLWRSHIGKDVADDVTARGWAFLEPWVSVADAVIVTRPSYAPPFELAGPVHVIAPSIDPLAPKNVGLDGSAVLASLVRAGIVEGDQVGAVAQFVRRDGTVGQVRPHTNAVLDGGPVPVDTQGILQVSRWDALKDFPGVLQGFAAVADRLPDNTRLVLVGPSVEGVTDDPEGAEELARCRALRAELPGPVRNRVHIIALPMDDGDENAHLVNCMQRAATVVVQKSLVEGFGLTVTEAMWKAKPMVASGVGGIQDQIDHGVSGLLLHDPTDLAAYGEALVRVMSDADLAAMLARGAHERVLHDFIGDRHLKQYGVLIEELLGGS